MKYCSSCEQTLPEESFSKNKAKADGLNSKCKSCQKIYYATYYQSDKEKERLRVSNARRKQELIEILRAAKDVPCMDCGQRYPYYVMDFDHRDPTQKVRGVAEMILYSKRQLIAEINKCDVVCANCHRIRTHSIPSGTLVLPL